LFLFCGIEALGCIYVKKHCDGTSVAIVVLDGDRFSTTSDRHSNSSPTGVSGTENGILWNGFNERQTGFRAEYKAVCLISRHRHVQSTAIPAIPWKNQFSIDKLQQLPKILWIAATGVGVSVGGAGYVTNGFRDDLRPAQRD
jgi:hypothetical protein